MNTKLTRIHVLFSLEAFMSQKPSCKYCLVADTQYIPITSRQILFEPSLKQSPDSFQLSLRVHVGSSTHFLCRITHQSSNTRHKLTDNRHTVKLTSISTIMCPLLFTSQLSSSHLSSSSHLGVSVPSIPDYVYSQLSPPTILSPEGKKIQQDICAMSTQGQTNKYNQHHKGLSSIFN